MAENITVRHYKDGDEAKIVDFLNLCCGEWGTVRKWQGLYSQYPTFDKDNVFIVESDDEVIGHRGLHFRDLMLRGNKKVSTALLGDTAVHPNYRGSGIYDKLHGITLRAAAAKGGCLAFTWNLKGSSTYNHNKKTGFVEIKQALAYMKITNPEKIFRGGLFDLIYKNQKLKKTLQNLNSELYFCLGKSEFSIAELLGVTNQKPKGNRETIKLIFDESSLSALASFRNRGKLWRIRCLALLALRRKMKVKFGSVKAFVNLTWKWRSILGSV